LQKIFIGSILGLTYGFWILVFWKNKGGDLLNDFVTESVLLISATIIKFRWILICL